VREQRLRDRARALARHFRSPTRKERSVHGTVAVAANRVDVRAGGDQRVHDIEMTAFGSEMQRRRSDVVTRAREIWIPADLRHDAR
jgi:hypothetical protein